MDKDGGIELWDIYDIRDATVHQLCERLVTTLEGVDVYKYDVKTVLVEQQMQKKMIGISYAIVMYFMAHRVPCRLVGARVKQRYLVEKTSYKDRKQSAVDFVSERVKGTPAEPHLDRHKKRDDMCDAYIYALHAHSL